MSAAGKFEDQFAIQQLPAKASGKLLPYGGAPTAIFARNRNYTNGFHVMSTLTSITVRARRNTRLSQGVCLHALLLIFEAFRPSLESVLRLLPQPLNHTSVVIAATLSLRCLSCRKIGTERRFFPSIEVLAQEFELAARRLQSHVPQYQPQRRVARLHHFDHCLRGANRIPWLLAAATRNCLPARTCSFGVIFDSVAGLLQGAPSPIRAERPRLHDHHLDPERLNLLRQCFRETFDGKLGRVIVARTREPDESANRRNINDVPAPALPHARQDRPGHVDETEEVSLV